MIQEVVFYFLNSDGKLHFLVTNGGEPKHVKWLAAEPMADAEPLWNPYKAKHGEDLHGFCQWRIDELTKRLRPESLQVVPPSADRAWEAVLALCGDPRSKR